MQRIFLLILVFLVLSCRRGEDPSSPVPQLITSDQQLFALVTTRQAASGLTLFPHADSVVSGSLNGSNAHQPMVRVALDAAALGALPGGRAPEGLSFPDGSMILKEIRMNGETTLYAVLFKERSNPLSRGGWLWAEFTPDGRTVFSIQRRGDGCISCHTREAGPQHDYIRTFERQRPLGSAPGF